LFPWGMRGGLFTDAGAGMSESVLSRPTFSGPVDCADLVNGPQGIESKEKSSGREVDLDPSSFRFNSPLTSNLCGRAATMHRRMSPRRSFRTAIS